MKYPSSLFIGINEPSSCFRVKRLQQEMAEFQSRIHTLSNRIEELKTALISARTLNEEMVLLGELTREIVDVRELRERVFVCASSLRQLETKRVAVAH